MKKIKFITCIYSDLHGTEFGGRSTRGHHYRLSLLSLLKMSNADFVCYTSNREIEDLKNFFYIENKINIDKLQIIEFDLSNELFKDLIKKYKDIEYTKKNDRCIEIQYMKFIWASIEDMSYDYYYWIDSGLSHCGLIPEKHRSFMDTNNYRKYFESNLFNNNFLNNIINVSDNKFLIISKENQRNFWSNTVNREHFKNYNNSRHIIGGLFGGKKELWIQITNLFKEYLINVTEHDKRLYHEEDIMTLMYRNHEDLFKTLEFDTWWHENERIAEFNMLEHLKTNKSFYKILEELNGIYE